MKQVLAFLILIVSMAAGSAFFSNEAAANVWETVNDWSPKAEAGYQDWVANNWDKQIFAKPGFFRNVTPDCADAVYAMRLIYAAQNGLPFAMVDPTGSGNLISNRMTRWDGMNTEAKKREFLNYVFQVAGTSSLPEDSYPVGLNRAAIGAGRFLLTDAASHHSWTVKYLSPEGIPFLIFASRPAKVGMFERFEYPTTGFLFPRGLRPESNAGFRAFRKIADLGKPVWEVPGYSLEQYRIPIQGWAKSVQRSVATRSETSAQGLTRILENACRGVRERDEIVQKADLLNRKLGRVCMDANQFEDYSTPSRDTRLKGSFSEFNAVYTAWQKSGVPLAPTIASRVASVLKGDQGVGEDEYCSIDIAGGASQTRRRLSLGQVYARTMAGYLSSNPHDSVLARWGIEASPGSKARSCGAR